MVLSNLKPNRGANRPTKKIGRGNGSGHGRTSCRGSNGANSRAGATHYARFEGGQMPLQRRLPKRGFRNFFAVEFTPVNLGDVSVVLGDVSVVDVAFLQKVGLIKNTAECIKILGDGEISKAATWKGFVVSKVAADKIAKCGGKLEDCRITEVKIIEKPVKVSKTSEPAKAPVQEKSKAPKTDKKKTSEA